MAWAKHLETVNCHSGRDREGVRKVDKGLVHSPNARSWEFNPDLGDRDPAP